MSWIRDREKRIKHLNRWYDMIRTKEWVWNDETKTYDKLITCHICKQTFEISLTSSQLAQLGTKNVQDSRPEIHIDDRELLISGICGQCFDSMMKDGE
jgi:hypothetical protein